MLITPIAWFFLPVLLYKTTGLFLTVEVVLIYILWAYLNKDIPDKKVTEVVDTNYLASFRPIAKYLITEIKEKGPDGIANLFKQPDVNLILIRTELQTTDFINKIINPFTTNKSFIFRWIHQIICTIFIKITKSS